MIITRATATACSMYCFSAQKQDLSKTSLGARKRFSVVAVILVSTVEKRFSLLYKHFPGPERRASETRERGTR